MLAPFSEARILLPLPAAVTRVSELKRYLVSSLHSVSGVTQSSKDLRLEVDGFELLSSSEVDILRDSDVVRSVCR